MHGSCLLTHATVPVQRDLGVADRSSAPHISVISRGSHANEPG